MTLSIRPSSFNFSLPPVKDYITQAVHSKIAKAALYDSILVFGSILVTAPFYPSYYAILSTTSFASLAPITNIGLRCLKLVIKKASKHPFFHWAPYPYPNPKTVPAKLANTFHATKHLIGHLCYSVLKLQMLILKYATCLFPAYIYSSLVGVLIHECGHAVAAMTLFNRAMPSITMTPFGHAATEYYLGELTAIGAHFGKELAIAIVTASGYIATTLFSTLLLFSSYLLEHVKSVLNVNYLTFGALNLLIKELTYIQTPLIVAGEIPASHDSNALWNFGIHPNITTFAYCICPLLCLYLCRQSGPKNTVDK